MMFQVLPLPEQLKRNFWVKMKIEDAQFLSRINKYKEAEPVIRIWVSWRTDKG